MGTNYDTLKAALLIEVEAIDDAIRQAEALCVLDQYIAALTKQAESSATNIQSYSIAGRSVNRTTPQEYSVTVGALKAQLYSLIYGSVVHADLRGADPLIDTATNTEV